MKKIYLLLFLCNSFFSVHAQNKKELNASILRLQSDSAAMSNTLEEKERIILKKINKIEELHSLTKSNISEIENLKKIITENEKLISHKNIIIDSLVMDLTAMNDSLTSIIEAYGCNQDVKEYYYSLEALTTPKYYAYTCKEDSSRSQYWKMSADIENRFLITEAFNSSLEQFEYFKEKFDSNGSQLVEYIMINGEDRTTTTLISKDVFMWNPEEEYNYSVKYPNDDDQILFRKSRKLIGKEPIEIMGKKLDALKFKGTYYYESEKHNESMEYWQFSYHTKEYGYVKYERHVDNGQVITLELTNLLSEEDWNKLK